LRLEIEIVDEAVLAAIFDAEAQGDDEIAERLLAFAQEPGRRERLAGGDAQQGLLARLAQRMAVLAVEVACHVDEDRRVFRANGVETQGAHCRALLTQEGSRRR
jgi:hypothetical protein